MEILDQNNREDNILEINRERGTLNTAEKIRELTEESQNQERK